MPELNDKQEMFCQEYLIDFNATRAAIGAGHTLFKNSGSAYFVYLLCDPDTSEIFYIGKGKNKRPYHHIKEAKSGQWCNFKKCAKIKTLITSGKEIDIIYFAIDLSERDAFSLERKLIKHIGRSHLTNVASGGPQDISDWAVLKLKSLKKLSQIFTVQRTAYEVELYFRIVRELRFLSITNTGQNGQ